MPLRSSANDREPRSYVVRVYRKTTRGLAGHVEDVQKGVVRAFRTPAEMWSAIGGRDEPVQREEA
jgi:hypothetical protein